MKNIQIQKFIDGALVSKGLKIPAGSVVTEVKSIIAIPPVYQPSLSGR